MGKNTRNTQAVSTQKSKPFPKHLEHINLYAAGIDIGATSHFVAVPEGTSETTVREFKTFTSDLYALADWLKKCGIQTIAMESTGVYWVRHEVAMQTVAAESHLHATYCSVSSSLPEHAIGAI